MRNKKLTDIELPVMQCDPQCGQCCGVVACSEPDYERVKQFAIRNNVKPLRQGSQCVWYQSGECAVYDARPFVCRVFGHFPDLDCPHGYNQNVTADMQAKLVKRFMQESGGVHFLHEAAYTVDEVRAIVDSLGKSSDDLPASQNKQQSDAE